MADKEEIVEIFSELRNFADNDIHPVVSPENWHVYSKLRDLIDQAEEDILGMLKEQEPQKVKLEERKILDDDSYDEAAYSIDKFFHCPRCNVILSRTNKNSDIRFCSNCGQAVEWK